jgi:valyl-tRNA synthetase
MNIDELMPKQFAYQDAESRLYSFWEERDLFSAKVDPSKPAFCVVIPPPNVTGILHMGHVLDNIPQDVMTRWHRMRGYSAVWIPGTDHAGIATQNVVKKMLEKEGIDMRSLGREGFIERVWQWKEKSGATIIQQLKRLGCSCDWKRERFTMDPGMVKAVLTAFVRYYEKGLIYRGKRMINWCTVCGTALADDEVEHAEHQSSLWHLRYPLVDASGNDTGEFITVATTRPETMLGDTGVAVHPADERYTSMVGRKVRLPLQNRLIPIVADDFVDPTFGTGMVKLTPGHDPNDYRAGVKLGLAIEIVIGEDGKMTEAAGAAYVGLDRFAARKKVVADLDAGGFLVETEKHKNAVGECYRCRSVIEPLISDQWFVAMRPLAEKAKAAVVEGKLQIIPDSEKHDYFHWMDTIEDWCISRQLWWGHRIPVYYCDSCGEVSASVETPDACKTCGTKELRQDEDVLDTWFSSQLWPFATLGWPEKTPDLAYWYPNSWLMSGRDILFFWDARMIMSGMELMGDVPFRTLVLHGLVRDSQGRKLSKSLGNSPDPLELFSQYGTDAIRAAITANYPMGRQDTKLSEELFRNGQALVIKLWNASRLLLGNLGDQSLTSVNGSPQALEDRWILGRLKGTVEIHDQYLAKSDVSHAWNAVTQFFWDEYCDWYLEIIKPRLWGSNEPKLTALTTGFRVLSTLYKLMHPYVPFVTEELWQILRKSGAASVTDYAALAASKWPRSSDFAIDNGVDESMGVMISLVRGLRDVRQHLGIGAKDPLPVDLAFVDLNKQAALKSAEGIARSMGYVAQLGEAASTEPKSGYVPFNFDGGVAFVKVPETVDTKDIVSKLDQKILKLEKGLSGVMSKLENTAFVENAPPELVGETRGKAAEMQEALKTLRAFQKSLL